jgi:hypothetical protein
MMGHPAETRKVRREDYAEEAVSRVRVFNDTSRFNKGERVWKVN